MAWSGGTYTKPLSWTANTTISATDHNTQDADFTTGINSCLVKDGTNAMTANLNFGGFRPSNVAAGSAATCSFAPGGSANNGMFLAATNELGFSTDGVERFRISNTGEVGIAAVPGTGIPVQVKGGTANVGGYSGVSGFFAADNSILFNSGVILGSVNGTVPYVGASKLGTGTDTPLAFYTAATERARISETGVVQPGSDNAYTLGASGIRWSAVWAANGTIQTSDLREKNSVTDSVLGLTFVKSLRPVSYKWNVGGNLVEAVPGPDGKPQALVTPQPGARTHWGLIAQEVKAAVDAAGVDFGGWVLSDKNDPDSQQALRYDQFVAPLIQAVKELAAKVEALETQVAGLAF